MATYFKNIKSFEDLKKQFRELLKSNHPDNGGNEEVMKEINVEFDALFPIWKNRAEKETGETINETASGYRRKFYTQNGWEGSRYDANLSLKEIAKIVRTYVKEKYPTCKFSVRTSYASMCQELHVEIKEFPAQMFKSGDDLRKEGLYEHIKATGYDGKPLEYDRYKEEIDEMERKLRRNRLFELDSWTDEDLIQAYEKAVEKNPFYGIKTEYFKSVLEDVDSFVQSYNYDDSDGMVDYFDNNFYYFNCKFDNCKYVPKTARIKKQEAGVQRTQKEQKKQDIEESTQIEQKKGYTYKITQGEDTRDGSVLWLVKILDNLDKAAYIAENKAMKERGGYYSKFKHAFLFRNDPTEILKVEGIIA